MLKPNRCDHRGINGIAVAMAGIAATIVGTHHSTMVLPSNDNPPPNKNSATCIEEIWNEFPSLTQYEVRSALAKCGLTTKHIESKVKVLSGGEQAKVRLCKLINKPTNILLLDEPTNHLDVDAKSELKRALSEYKGSILMVCHEPEFYDRLATDVWDCSQWSTRI